MIRIKSAVLFVILGAVVSIAQVKIACIGNSITEGWSPAKQAYDTSTCYPTRLQHLLGTQQYTVRNEGVGYMTVQRTGSSYMDQGKLGDVFAFKPDIVTIILGTNDAKVYQFDPTRFKTDYLALIDDITNTLTVKPRIILALCTPLFDNSLGISWGFRDSIMNLIIPVIRQIASERGLSLIDANTPLRNFPQYFSADGVHPDASGQDTIAHVFYRALTSAVEIAAHPSAHAGYAAGSCRRTTFVGWSPANSTARVSADAIFDLRGIRVSSEDKSR